jgi:hypothetical protein
MKKERLFTMLIAFLMTFNVMGQEEPKEFTPTFNWSGFTHIWTGYVQRDTLDGHYGFAVRYLRFKAFGKLTENVKWTAQFAFDKGIPSFLDVHMSYEPKDYLKVRFGQFPVPGAKSGVFSSPIWSTTKMVFNDRTTVTQNWASNAGLKGYRSGGLMFYGSVLDKMISYYVMAAMPHAGPNYYFNPSVKTPVYENDENGTALFSRLEVRPYEKTEVGFNFHTGQGTSFDTIQTNRGSYSFYVLTRQKKFFAMAEYIGGTNEQLINDVKDSDFSYSGYYVEVAYKFSKKYEPAIRYDSYTPIVDGSDGNGYKKYDNVTIGINYYPTKNIAIMANYVARMEDPEAGVKEIDNNLIYFQLRYKFASKK